MQEGFDYLETGQYKEAEIYFENVLKSYPEQKTARLCYGRAVGLNKKPTEALNLFTDLLNDFPNDYEVKLNYGESLLWCSKFPEAKIYFAALIEEQPNNFAALLSYANTLSNLKEYEEALIYIEKALAVSENNPNALISKKYLYLGFAYQKQQAQEYEASELLLKENLTFFPNDPETLQNLANLYLIANKLESAETTYQILQENPAHVLVAKNGRALVAHLKGKEKKALEISQESFDEIQDDTDEKVKKSTIERYIQALIWNKKFSAASELITSELSKSPEDNGLLALRATLSIYKSDFRKSLDDYEKILESNPESFDGNLGKANALKGLGRIAEAYEAADQTLVIYENQKDAKQFIKNLDLGFTPFVENKTSFAFDNGNNEAVATNTTIQVPLSLKFAPFIQHEFRTTKNTITQNQAESNIINSGLIYEIAPRIKLKGIAGFASAKTESKTYLQSLLNVSVKIESMKLQNLELGYSREIQNFNADLLDREIVQNNFYANYNLSTNYNVGWFTQYYFTSQNDANNRNLLFTSLYYNILPKPALKAGFNYQFITFKNQLPSVYFSPEKFNAAEIFINVIKDEAQTKIKSCFYNLTAAVGYQFIESDPKQSTYRLQGAFGYKFSERSLLNVYGTHSNIASATVAGFTFTEVGLRFKWMLFEKPIFTKKSL